MNESPLMQAAAEFVAAELGGPGDVATWQERFRAAIRASTAPRSVERMQQDGRAVPWRVRLQLFDSFDELSADTDPDLALNTAGSDVVRGLPAVAAWAQGIAELFHDARGDHVEWLTAEQLDSKLKSIRPVLSRNGGFATWRLVYHVNGEQWRAVIDLRREEESSE